MRNAQMQDEFLQLGGTELAPMSTTTSLQVTLTLTLTLTSLQVREAALRLLYSYS